MRLFRGNLICGIPLGALCAALACTKLQSGTGSDTASATKANAGQITDSIIPGGPHGAVSSNSSTPTARANTSTTTHATTQSTSKRTSSGGEQDSAVQPKFSIDEKGVVRPVKH